MMLPQHESLFAPMAIGKLKLENRIVLAPTHVGMGAERGMVTDQILCYYYARASGGVGLIIVELTGVTGRYAFSPGLGLGAASDRNIPGLRDLATVIHWGGAKAIIQLVPGEGAQALYHHPKRPLVGPSDVPALIQKEELPKAMEGFLTVSPEQPRPLSVEEVQALVDLTVRAAIRAKKAGFDGVELHGAHGYLLCQFTSPYFNHRDDDFGGTPEKRWRLSTELIRAIKDALGKNFVVGYRFSAREWIPGGLDLPEALEMAKAIQEAGADYLSVSHGCYGAATRIFPEGADLDTKTAVSAEDTFAQERQSPFPHVVVTGLRIIDVIPGFLFIEVLSGEGMGRARIHTDATGAASDLLRCPGGQRRIGIYRGKSDTRPVFPGDQQGALPYPAQPGQVGRGLVGDKSRVRLKGQHLRGRNRESKISLFHEKLGKGKGGLIEAPVHDTVHMVDVVHDQGPVAVISDRLNNIVCQAETQGDGPRIFFKDRPSLASKMGGRRGQVCHTGQIHVIAFSELVYLFFHDGSSFHLP